MPHMVENAGSMKVPLRPPGTDADAAAARDAAAAAAAARDVAAAAAAARDVAAASRDVAAAARDAATAARDAAAGAAAGDKAAVRDRNGTALPADDMV